MRSWMTLLSTLAQLKEQTIKGRLSSIVDKSITPMTHVRLSELFIGWLTQEFEMGDIAVMSISIVQEAYRRLDEDRLKPRGCIRRIVYSYSYRRNNIKKPIVKRVSMKTVHEGTLEEMAVELDGIAKVLGTDVQQTKKGPRVIVDLFQKGEKIVYFIKPDKAVQDRPKNA